MFPCITIRYEHEPSREGSIAEKHVLRASISCFAGSQCYGASFVSEEFSDDQCGSAMKALTSLMDTVNKDVHQKMKEKIGDGPFPPLREDQFNWKSAVWDDSTKPS